jgi:hypothetical protein
MDPLDLISLNPRARFRRQPLPVLGEQRIIWRIALIATLLHIAGRTSREAKKRMSLRKLHILAWGIRSEKSCEAVRARLQSDRVTDLPAIRVDPGFNQAIDFACAEMLTSCTERHIDILPKGELMAQQVADLGILVDERRRAVILKPFCTEKAIEQLSRNT